MRPRPRAGVLLVLACLSGCGGKGTGDAASRDTLTRRQRDSVIGNSRLPGAAGVRGALRAVDSAAARNGRLDSIRP